MEGEELVKLRLAHPFRPFTLITAKGRRLAVNKPYHLAISSDRTQILCELPDGGYLTFKPASIATVEMNEAGGNGHPLPGEVGGLREAAQ